MQAVKPVAEPDRDALLKDIAFFKHAAFCAQDECNLAKQFEDYAVRCLELARSAKTAGRAHFMQMAREYQSAAALIRERTDLSAGYHNWHPLQPPYDFDGWPQNLPSVREARNDQSIAR